MSEQTTAAKELAIKLVTYVLPRRGQEVFLVRYLPTDSPNPKRSGYWIPAPELENGGHPDEGCRKVQESLGFGRQKAELVGVDAFTTRDWHVLFQYVVDVDKNGAASLASGYEDGRWFALDALPPARDMAHGPWEIEMILKMARASTGLPLS